ncbi:hypothetical protein EROM_110220 [Encephalitozoon romaleae SJ-2008]|uniref:Uncharacterized protein n=1 Tax=Encephalitozoon romaleae (strain SJ-2008) TaxID=1178016 RepID=I7AGT6_ENCRO|nr:hypothetical protein EROM_110220 [Encephalitozoon romaleae SJ-2008]AFN84005.1 hypothetical protein EROM_110220 [Encephalitozoon romaleae SJ-2008]
MTYVSEEEALWVSKLDLEEESISRACFSFDIMRCKMCSEIFHAKWHEDHPCFSKDIDKQLNQRIEPITFAEGRLKDFSGDIQSYEYLKEALRIRPVVNKIWRLPHALLAEERKLWWKWIYGSSGKEDYYSDVSKKQWDVTHYGQSIDPAIGDIATSKRPANKAGECRTIYKRSI